MAFRRILVVDDNVDGARSVAELLRLWGHEVEVAHDGLTAVASARKRRPEFVLLDLGMPGIDGFQVAKMLRLEPGLEAMRIIAVTVQAGDEDRRLGREAGIDQHLVKPVDPRFLQSLLGA